MSTGHNEPEAVRQAGKDILDAGGDCSTRTDLLAYLSGLGTVASAVRFGLINASWRVLLSDGAPLNERASVAEILDRLSRPDTDELQHPGEAAFTMLLANVMQLAENLASLTSSAWVAGVAEDTRAGVEQAHSERARRDKDGVIEMMEGIAKALRDSVSPEARREVEAAIQKEFRALRQRGQSQATPEGSTSSG